MRNLQKYYLIINFYILNNLLKINWYYLELKNRKQKNFKVGDVCYTEQSDESHIMLSTNNACM